MSGSRNNMKENSFWAQFYIQWRSFATNYTQTTKKNISIYFCCTRNFQETENLQPIVSDNFCMVIHVWFVQITKNVFKSRTTIYIFNIPTTYDVFFEKQYKGRYILVTFKCVRCRLRARTEFVIKHFLFSETFANRIEGSFHLFFDRIWQKLFPFDEFMMWKIDLDCF